MKKIRVGVLFGGKSAEHQVSLLSAQSVIHALDKNKYEIVLIGINPEGEWFLQEDLSRALLHANDPERIQLQPSIENVTVVSKASGNPLVSLSGRNLSQTIDVVFPVLHGTFGEDGTIQGLLKLANLPFVGAGVLASAVGMDKDVMKRLFRDAGIPTAKFKAFFKHQRKDIHFEKIVEELGLPLFVKPANLGSSVGISKIKSKEDFYEMIDFAFQYDRKILIEEFIKGREIECAVLGNETPIASLPGEIIPQHEFYSYEAKYIDANGAKFAIPVQLPEAMVSQVQTLAIQAFKALCCEGMARVDMFLTENNELVMNELNTIPGFTKISMYPKLWEVSGLSYPELIDKLIQLALDRFEKEAQLSTQWAENTSADDGVKITRSLNNYK